MQKPLKTVFLFEDLCYGGTQKQNLALASRLDRHLFSPSLITMTGPTDLDQEAIKLDVPVINMGASRKIASLFFLKLHNYLKQERPDILILCTALPNIWGRIWGKILKIPVVIGTCRGGGAPLRQHERFLWSLTNKIIYNSPALIDAMTALGVPASHLKYIANGIDTDIFQACDKKDTSLIVCVARLAKDKNHATLLEAFKKISSKMPQAKLRLVGEGPEEKNLKIMADKILPPAVRQRVEFAGAASNTLRHYQEAAVFALSSEKEGQPNVILEAMSCQLPVCATSVGGIPNLVQDGVNGLLSPVHDAQTLADNLLKILENPQLAERMGEEGRKIVKNNFSFAKMTMEHQNIFLESWDYCKKGK